MASHLNAQDRGPGGKDAIHHFEISSFRCKRLLKFIYFINYSSDVST